jgi:hypothetical protein
MWQNEKQHKRFHKTLQYKVQNSSNNVDEMRGWMERHARTSWKINMTAFWDIASCSLVEVDRRFRQRLAPW